MFQRFNINEKAGNIWYGRMVIAVSSSFLFYFIHMGGFEAVGYTGFIRRYELFVWLSLGASAFALYCWYRGDRVGL